jgi:hypothetical protein
MNRNYSRWFDRQAFESWNYVQYCRKYSDSYRRLDPLAKTGFEGAGQFSSGDDLDLIVRTLGFWVPYPGAADEVIRSIAPRNFIRSNWMGSWRSDRFASSLLQKYWRMVTLGMDSIWFWRWETIGKYNGFLAPDLRPFPAIKELLEDTQIIRDGLGDLLLHSEMQDDGIAILYSYPSVFATTLEDGPSFGTYEEAHIAAQVLLRGLGLQFRYVTDRMLRLGEFDKAKYKLLILPRAEAIGDKEASAIRSFVEEGGTIIADLRPGLYGDHCKPGERGVLDDLFGVTRIGRLKSMPIWVPTAKGHIEIAVDPGIKLDEATLANQTGGIPFVISRKVGTGRAILLNCEMNKIHMVSSGLQSGYLSKKTFQPSIAERILTEFQPAVRLKGRGDKWPENVAVTRWHNQGIEIVSLLRSSGPDEEITIVLPKNRYVYDLRTRKALGRRSQFATKLLTNRANFFVLTNRLAAVPKLTTDKVMVKPGEVAKIKLFVPDAEGLHVLRIHARLGENNCGWFKQNIVSGQEVHEIDFPIAFNDPQGTYEINATDLFTNESAVTQVTVMNTY